MTGPGTSALHRGGAPSWWRNRGSLGAAMAGRSNGFGLIRLVLALAVVVSHSNPLGYGRLDPGTGWSGAQTNLGTLSVIGFFVISGFMITGSGLRLGIGRFAWHRALRLLPGLWVCLAVTAFLVAPVLYHHQHGSLAGFWSHPDGPLQYFAGMWNTSISNGFDIAGIMRTGVHQGTNYNAGFDGALWSLQYEIFCYVLVGLFALGGLLRRAPRTVALLAGALWVLILENLLDAPGLRGAPAEPTTLFDVPVLGPLSSHYIVYLGFVFLLGATMRLYRDRVPVNDLLALGCLVAAFGSMHYGAFFVVGCPAFAYLVMWLGVRLPKRLHRIGHTHDYSYGIYIYGFVVEQVLVMYHGTRWGQPAYLAMALVGTLVPAVLSCHLIEEPALKLKDWAPGFLSRGRDAAGAAAESVAVELAEPAREELSGLR